MIPLRTDTPVRGTPLANYVLVAANLLVFVLTDVIADEAADALKLRVLALDAEMPRVWQFFTYQFVHGDIWHLGGNMLFLWVFGNSVNSKFGNLAYLMFYLAAGAFAGWGFSLTHEAPLLGASGAIAAVTTTFMVLFPRSRILFLFFAFIITTFELPSLWVIMFKIVLWDNVLAPALLGSGQGVAYEAHLYGNLFGVVATTGMLAVGALSRDQFDLPAILKRWNQRRSFAAAMSDPQAQARAKYGTVARTITLEPAERKELEAQLSRVAELRSGIRERLADSKDHEAAVDLYEQLMTLSPDQCLPCGQQLQIAGVIYALGKYPQAAAAFEKYLKQYPTDRESTQTRLLVGIIYARDLSQYEAAQGHLKLALESLTQADRIAQCREWLERVSTMLGTPSTDAG